MKYLASRLNELDTVGSLLLQKLLYRANYWKRSRDFKRQLFPLLMDIYLTRLDTLPLDSVGKMFAIYCTYEKENALFANSNIRVLFLDKITSRFNEINAKIAIDLMKLATNKWFLQTALFSQLFDLLMNSFVQSEMEVTYEAILGFVSLMEKEKKLSVLDSNIIAVHIGAFYKNSGDSDVEILVDSFLFCKTNLMTKAIFFFKNLLIKKFTHNLQTIKINEVNFSVSNTLSRQQ